MEVNTMQIQSTRFGTIDIADDAVIEFADGIIGLPGRRYALVAQQEGSSFYWLHSVDDPSVALPVTQPWLFFPSYDVAVSDEDSAKLGLESADQADVFCVVRAAQELEDFTVNLRGPIVVHASRRVGRQVINEAGEYDVRQPLFAHVQLSQAAPASSSTPIAATGV
jgi:flagellar assembly factor FliW